MTSLRRSLIIALAAASGACVRATPSTAPERAVEAPVVAVATPAPESAAAPASSDEAALRPVSPDEVRRRALEVFGDSAVVRDAAPVPAESTDALAEDGLSTGAHASNERVTYYVDAFRGPARTRIEQWLERGSRYEPMIRARLREAGLPEDFVYLALIESGYDPHAYSRAAAVGMWQFMAPTARGMGLRVDWWVDERRDPVKSTDAAARFLRYLNEQFDSYYLAAAAYNGGPGRVARGLERFSDDMEGITGDAQFFALAEQTYLPRETKDYVPKLIAAAIVARDPAGHGLTVRPQPAYAFDSVRVPPSTPLAAVARAAAASDSAVRELNPHVLRGVTPPTGAFWVRVPTGASYRFDSTFRQLPEASRIAFTRVTSKKGQSMASIARAHALTTRQLAWYNPGVSTLRSGNLRAGQTLLVPRVAVVSLAREVPDPSNVGTSRARAARAVTHVVKRGETLSHLSRRYGLSVAAIMRLNGLRKQTIFAGQALVVRGGTRVAAASTSTARRATSRAARPDLRRSASARSSSRSTTARSSTARSSTARSSTARASTARRSTAATAKPKASTPRTSASRSSTSRPNASRAATSRSASSTRRATTTPRAATSSTTPPRKKPAT